LLGSPVEINKLTSVAAPANLSSLIDNRFKVVFLFTVRPQSYEFTEIIIEHLWRDNWTNYCKGSGSGNTYEITQKANQVWL